jgi:hypothetical protein
VSDSKTASRSSKRRQTTPPDRLITQIRHSSALGDEDSFNGLVWSAGVHGVVCSATYHRFDLDEEVRYRLNLLTQSPSPFVKEWLEDAESDIGAGVDRVRTLEKLALKFGKTGTTFDQATRLAANPAHRVVCDYLAAYARLSGKSVRAEIKDIAAGLRDYGGYGPDAVREASLLDRKYERSIAHIPIETSRKRASRDALALTRLLPSNYRPLRLVVYEAARDGDVRTVKDLVAPLAEAMGCSERDVFIRRPKADPQTLPLREEPALQQAFAKYAELRDLAGVALSSIFAILIGMAMLMSLASVPAQAGDYQLARGPTLIETEKSPGLRTNWKRIDEPAVGIRLQGRVVTVAGGTGPKGLHDPDIELDRTHSAARLVGANANRKRPFVGLGILGVRLYLPKIAGRPGTGPIG